MESYRLLSEDVEGTVGRINGTFDSRSHTAIRYLHHSYPVEEMVASIWPPTSCWSPRCGTA